MKRMTKAFSPSCLRCNRLDVILDPGLRSFSFSVAPKKCRSNSQMTDALSEGTCCTTSGTPVHTKKGCISMIIRMGYL